MTAWLDGCVDACMYGWMYRGLPEEVILASNDVKS